MRPCHRPPPPATARHRGVRVLCVRCLPVDPHQPSLCDDVWWEAVVYARDDV
jgi:hypothetical protein